MGFSVCGEIGGWLQGEEEAPKLSMEKSTCSPVRRGDPCDSPRREREAQFLVSHILQCNVLSSLQVLFDSRSEKRSGDRPSCLGLFVCCSLSPGGWGASLKVLSCFVIKRVSVREATGGLFSTFILFFFSFGKGFLFGTLIRDSMVLAGHGLEQIWTPSWIS